MTEDRREHVLNALYAMGLVAQLALSGAGNTIRRLFGGTTERGPRPWH